MTIYQIHRYSGQYEDFEDIIVGSYLKKERAEEEKAKLETDNEKKKEQSRKCINCPFIEEPFSKLKKLTKQYPEHCSITSFYERSGCIDCNNLNYWYEDATFDIEEVEVEE